MRYLASYSTLLGLIVERSFYLTYLSLGR